MAPQLQGPGVSDLAQCQPIIDTSFPFNLASGKCLVLFKHRGPVFNMTLACCSIELTMKRDDPSEQKHYPPDKMIQFTVRLALINRNEM